MHANTHPQSLAMLFNFRIDKTKKKKKGVVNKSGYFWNGGRKERFRDGTSFLSTSNILFLSVMLHVFTLQYFIEFYIFDFYTFLISFIFL